MVKKKDEDLFPKALNAIKDKKTWEKMKVESDKIGYTSFYNPNKDK